MQHAQQRIGGAGIALSGVALTPAAVSSRWSDRERRAGGIAARTAAAAATGLAPREVVVLRRPGASPLALTAGRRRRLDVSLSLAHRLGRALAAAAPGGTRIGIDLEREGVVPPGTERLFVAEPERPLLEAYGAAAVWALKEAAWKALELPTSLPFHAVRLRSDESGAIVGLETPDSDLDAAAELWTPWPRFVAALVWLPAEAA